MNYINFSILAHIDAGKTTITDRILYLTNTINYIGNVDDGTTVTDYLDEERERGISIVSGIVNAKWKDTELQVVDTPGHIDFIGEVIAPLSVVDNAISIICGIHGVETQTEIIWKILKNKPINKFIFINKLDRENNFYHIVDSLKNKLNITPLILTIPYYEDNNLIGIIDIIKQKLVQFENGFISKENNVPESYRDISLIYYDDIIDILSKYDDNILLKTLNGTIEKEDIRKGIKYGVASGLFIPIFSGSAIKNIGISTLLDGVVSYFSYTSEKKLPVKNIDDFKNIGNSNLLYIFKVLYDKNIGNIFLARVYGGNIYSGMKMYNSNSKQTEIINNIYTIFADSFTQIDSAKSGMIIALDGLIFSKVADTLCDIGCDINLGNSEYPTPVIYQKLIPKDRDSYEKFEKIINNILLTEQCLSIKDDKDSGYLTIGGMGELHIDVFLNRLKREHNIEFKAFKPTVAIRKKIINSGDIKYQTKLIFDNFDNNVDNNELLLNISLEIEPIDSDKNNISFEMNPNGKNANDITNNELLIKMARDGVDKAFLYSENYPIIGANLIIKDIELNSCVDFLLNNSILEFGLYNATNELIKKLEMIDYEPIMNLRVITPQNFTGAVLSDLNSRSIKISETIYEDGDDIIIGYVFLRNILRFSTALRNITKGKATFTLIFDRWGDSIIYN